MGAERRDWLRELMWSAARLSVPLGLLLAGCRTGLDPEPVGGTPCAPGARRFRPCTGQLVKVTTSLPSQLTLSDADCEQFCGHLYCQKSVFTPRCHTVGTVGEVADGVYCRGDCIPGRPPREVARPLPAESVADAWARMAWFEAQSVVEFERLAADLVRVGAPDQLIARARSAAQDERRHAELTSQLASRPVDLGPAPHFAPRTVEELAFDNFIGGCLNETGAAVRTAHQSLTWRELHAVAEDEAGHAMFSWDLHAWLGSVLSPAARKELAAAGRAQLAVMINAEEECSEAVRIATGLPDRQTWEAQMAMLMRQLWVPEFAALEG